MPAEVATARSARARVRATVSGCAAWRRPMRQGRPSGWMAEGADLADVEEDVAHAGVLQERRHAVGDVALRDAVQRDRHSGPGEADRRRPGLDGAPVHQRPRLGESALGRPARIRAALREVRRVGAPERLHGGVEGALRPFGEVTGLGQQGDEFQRGRREAAVAVEAGERARRPVEAEHVLQPVDLGDAARDQAARAGGVGAVQDDLGRSAQRDAGPAVQRRRLRARAGSREREAGRRRGDGDEAPPGRRGTHWCSPCAGIAASPSSP